MNTKSLVKILKKELAILSDFIDGFDENGTIHPTEIDLALSKTNDISEELLLLKNSDFSKMPEITLSNKSSEEPIVTKEVSNEANKLKHAELTAKYDKIPATDTIVAEKEKTDEQKASEPIESAIEEQISVDNIEVIEENTPKPTENEPTEHDKANEASRADDSNNNQILCNHDETQQTEAAELDEKIEPAEQENTDIDETQSEKKIIADKFSKETPSINDVLAGIKKNKDLASLLKDSPVRDLKKAIKLNDRIWYINELFNKNSSTFEKAISVVNSSENLDKALEYLFTNFTWDQNKKSTISFLELVFRRFASN